MIDWNDGTELKWEGPFDSGSTVSFSHIWTAKGTFQIKVKAKDDPNSDGDLSDGLESVWSDPLEVSMPRNRNLNTPFISFLQQYLILYHLFQLFLKI